MRRCYVPAHSALTENIGIFRNWVFTETGFSIQKGDRVRVTDRVRVRDRVRDRVRARVRVRDRVRGRFTIKKGIGLGLDGTPSQHMRPTCTWQHNAVVVTTMGEMMGP